jgi:hypothetical protein
MWTLEPSWSNMSTQNFYVYVKTNFTSDILPFPSKQTIKCESRYVRLTVTVRVKLKETIKFEGKRIQVHLFAFISGNLAYRTITAATRKRKYRCERRQSENILYKHICQITRKQCLLISPVKRIQAIIVH